MNDKLLCVQNIIGRSAAVVTDVTIIRGAGGLRDLQNRDLILLCHLEFPPEFGGGCLAVRQEIELGENDLMGGQSIKRKLYLHILKS